MSCFLTLNLLKRLFCIPLDKRKVKASVTIVKRKGDKGSPYLGPLFAAKKLHAKLFSKMNGGHTAHNLNPPFRAKTLSSQGKLQKIPTDLVISFL